MNRSSNDVSEDGDLLLTAVLHRFLRDFDCRGDRTFSWADIQCWPEQSFEKLEKLGLVAEVERARAVKVLDCIHRPIVEPLWLPDGDGRVIGAYSCGDPDCAAVHYVRSEETRQWRPSFEGLCRNLATILAMEFRFRELVSERLAFIGELTSCARPILISRAGGMDVEQAISSLASEWGSDPPIVVCVSRYPKRVRPSAAVFSLPELLRVAHGELCMSLMDRMDQAQSGIGNSVSGTMRRLITAQCVPFKGGELVFLPDWVELCGEKVLSNSRSPLMRSILEALCRVDGGRYCAIDGETLATAVDAVGGQGAIAGSIRDFRTRVTDQFREGRGVAVDRYDIIETTSGGYRLRDWITVRGLATVSAPPETSSTTKREIRRSQQILELIRSGNACSLPEIVRSVNVSQREAKMLLKTLKLDGKIRFTGAGRGGHYVVVK